ncbi:MAG: outer membrane beta-barrel protein [Gammaproteobacteria bacterium]|jgi:hypothetical protein
MKQKYILAVAAALGLVAVSQAAVAKGFNYSYGILGYRNLDSDILEGDGVQAGFSLGATDHIEVVGSYSRLFIDDREDASDVDLDLDEFKIGLGGHYSVHKKIDIGGTVSYVDQQYTGDEIPDGSTNKTNVNEDEEGYEVQVYARTLPWKKIELTPHIVHTNVGSVSTTGGGVGFFYNFYKDFSLRVRVTRFSEDSTSNVFAGVRLDF